MRPISRNRRGITFGHPRTKAGGSAAEGALSWRDAYDAIEAVLVLQLRRLSPQIGRLEDAPAEIAALLASVTDLTLTHSPLNPAMPSSARDLYRAVIGRS